MGALLVAGGVLWLLGVLDVLHLSATAILSGLLILVGLALITASWTGGRHAGLVALGVVLAIVLALASSFDVNLRGGVGDRTYRPTSLAELKREYRLGVGQMTVDLGDVIFPPGSRSRIDVHLGIGQVVVHVPEGLITRVHGMAGAGDVKLFGREESGLGPDLTDFPLPGFQEPNLPQPAVLFLEVSVGLGEVEVDAVSSS